MERLYALLLVAHVKIAARLYQFMGSIIMNSITLTMYMFGFSYHIPAFTNWFPLFLLNWMLSITFIWYWVVLYWVYSLFNLYTSVGFLTLFSPALIQKSYKFDNLDSFEQFSKLMDKQRSLLSGLIPVKGGRGLINWGLFLFRLIQAKAPSKSNVKILKHFSKQCFRISRLSGLGHLVKYLKTCSILLQQYVARNDMVFSGHQVGKVAVKTTRKGLPRLIPRLERRKIRKGDTSCITFWLSLLNLYRYLECSYGPVSFSTVTNPGVGWIPTPEVMDYIHYFWNHLQKMTNKVYDPLPIGTPFLTNKVSVAISEKDALKGTSYVAVIRAAHAFRHMAFSIVNSHMIFAEVRRKSNLLKGLLTVCKSTYPDLFRILTGLSGSHLEASRLLGSAVPQVTGKFIPDSFKPPSTGLYDSVLGRFAALYEAAGKIRIIAIVDPITQWALKPVHLWIFNILRRIPQDGTFDQDKPINLLMDLSRKSKDKFIGSCDMSAATDRLPILLQMHLLSWRFGPTWAKAWADTLIGRDYWKGITPYRYAVGQPMGALSSWGMLALTHHFLWQWAAWRSGFIPPSKWFREYAVLGDDSASRYHIVVDEYLKICSELGVQVNLSKSLLSSAGSLEFAKRFVTQRGNCSPVSMGEILVSKVNFSVMSNWPRKRSIRPADLLTLMGYRHKTLSLLEGAFISLPRKVRNMLIVLKSPWGALPSPTMEVWLRLSALNRVGNFSIDWVNAGIVLIEILYRLHTKSQRTVAWNALPNRMLGLCGGDKAATRLTESVRRMDDNTFRAIGHIIYEPVRRETFSRAKDVMWAITSLRVALMRDVFFLDGPLFQVYFETYLKLDEELNNLLVDSHIQVPKKNFVMPSAKSICRLYTKLHVML